MKKIILITILFFNLIPMLKKGELSVLQCQSVLADDLFGDGDTDDDFDPDVVCDFRMVSLTEQDLGNCQIRQEAVYEYYNCHGHLIETENCIYEGDKPGCVTDTPPTTDGGCDYCGGQWSWLFDPPSSNTGGTNQPEPTWDDFFNDFYDDYFNGNITTNDPSPKDPCEKLYGVGSTLQYCGCVGGTAPKVSCPTLCDSTSMAIGADVSSFFQNDSVQVRINQLTPFSNTPGQNEQVFLIKDFRPDPLGIKAQPIETIGPSGGSSSGITQFTKAKVHTHPKGKIPAPSATDFESIMNAWNQYKFFSDSYVLAADSSKFALHVSDTTKLKVFNNVNTNFADSLTNDFQGALLIKRNKIQDSFKHNNGLSDDESFTRALSIILEEAGITLLKADKGSNQFRKIGTAKRMNPDNTEAKDKDGTNKYVEADCQ